MILKRILLIIFGIILALFVIELLLNIGGYFVKVIHENKEITKNLNRDSSGFLNILCIGDSHTFGAGARPGFSYPEQLQRMIDKENMKYKVYNLGVPGTNSSTVLLNIPKWIKMYKPKVVILMIGCNDNLNFQNSNYYIFMKDKKSFFYWINRILFNLKTYKLFNLLIRSFSRKNVNFIKVENYPEDIKNKIRLVREYYFHIERNFDKSKEILNEILEIDKDNYDAYLMLGWIALDSDEFALAEKNLKRAKEINPYRSEAYEQLCRLYIRLGKYDLLYNTLKDSSSIFSDEKDDFKRIRIFGIPNYNDNVLWSKEVRYNLNKIIDFLKSNKINIILMNYPKPRPLHTEIINEIANKYKLIYIDNGIYLDKNTDNSYFSSDAHPNELGYGIIAKNVFNVLKEINNK